MIVVCGQDYLPTSITFPHPGNQAAPTRIKMQATASRPLCKRLWQTIIREKIFNQSKVLSWLQPENPVGKRLAQFAGRVKSGDPDNVEAQAARLYWSTFFGAKFSRNRQQDGENAFLNYSYTILRSAVVRSVVGSGLLPIFGIHHHNKRNAFPLVDDLMEPYRPLADMVAWEAFYEEDELGPSAKEKLVSVLTLDVQGERGITPLCSALHQIGYIGDCTEGYCPGPSKLKRTLLIGRTGMGGRWPDSSNYQPRCVRRSCSFALTRYFCVTTNGFSCYTRFGLGGG